ncbi:acyl-CoA N-acyltransferase [Xylaria digitata]|nr:acyl-CoA N-acyltransferase [Xylaria digitata]
MAIWRQLVLDDIEGLTQVAGVVHPGLPERDIVFMERLRLFPEGCLVLEEDYRVCGDAISHPIRYGQPPALDSLLGKIASEADQFYIHDVCVLPDLRGRGYAVDLLEKLLVIADNYSTTCLVPPDHPLPGKMCGYGDDAVYLERRKGN